MKIAAPILAPLALVATLLPPILFLFQAIGEGPMKTTMLIAAILWFVAAPHWLQGGER